MTRTRRTVCVAATVVLALTIPTSASAQEAATAAEPAPETRHYFFEEAGADSTYTLFVSSRYVPGVRAPLVVALHGRGAEPAEIVHAKGLLALADERGYIVVAPMGLNPFGGFGSRGPGRPEGRPDDPYNAGQLSELDVWHVIDRVEHDFAIDPRRVFLLGHSMGGAGALYLAGKSPARWAGMALFAPGSRTVPDITRLGNVRTIIFQGRDDPQVLATNTRRLVAQMRRTVTRFEYHEQIGDHFSIIAWSPDNIRRAFDFFEESASSSRLTN